MNPSFVSARESVAAALASYGAPGTIERQTEAVYDPMTGAVTSQTETIKAQLLLKAVPLFSPVRQSVGDGVFKATNVAVMLVEPLVDDLITVASKRYRVTEVAAKAPDGNPIMFTAGLVAG